MKIMWNTMKKLEILEIDKYYYCYSETGEKCSILITKFNKTELGVFIKGIIHYKFKDTNFEFDDNVFITLELYESVDDYFDEVNTDFSITNYL